MQSDGTDKTASGADSPQPEPPGPAFWASAGILLAFPPLVGYAILALVLLGEADGAVLSSGAAMCTALIVAALLILVPPVIYVVGAEKYNEYMGALKKGAKEIGSNG